MNDAYDTLEARLDQAISILYSIDGHDNLAELTPQALSGTIGATRELIAQAQMAFQEICAEQPPKSVEVRIQDEPEGVRLMRELRSDVSGVLVCMNTYLNEYVRNGNYRE
ncbi:hypothetical protein [Elongatibacter sediminis]|uniref:Uncharacterized protein n=1 Tax=Elongatibacter sediminis TaxID=3119006 RepID=A0AAW9RDH0_9GAMM